MQHKKDWIRMLVVVMLIPLIFLSLVLFMMLFNVQRYPENQEGILLQQYERLSHIEGRKIIVVGDETTAYGVDPDLLEQEIGLPAAVIGHQSAHGTLPYRLALRQAKTGDILVVAPNYYMWKSIDFQKDEALAALDGRPDLLVSFNWREMTALLNRLPAFFCKKLNRKIDETFKQTVNHLEKTDPINSPLFIDGRPSRTIEGEAVPLTEAEKEDPGKTYNFFLFNFSDETLDFFNEYRQLADRKGVDLLFSFPALYKEATIGEPELMDSLAEEITIRTGIEAISRPSSFLFEGDEMAGNIFLCNSKGIKRRTTILALDLKTYLEGKGEGIYD